MERFTTLTSRLAPLPVGHVDTDQIIPARFLKIVDKAGLADHLFADWRRDPDFVLNRPDAQGAEVLLAGENFGCGSSREHAPWALMAWGFRAIIAPGFADIFQANALKNGLLPVVVTAEVHGALVAAREADPGASVAIDLEAQTLRLPSGREVTFPMDAFARHCLLNGLDELGYLLSFEDAIAAYESGATP